MLGARSGNWGDVWKSACVGARLSSWMHCVIAREGKRYGRCSFFHGSVLGGLGLSAVGWDWPATDTHLPEGEGMCRSRLLAAALAGTCRVHLHLLNSCVTASFGYRLVVVARTKAACPDVLRLSRASQETASERISCCALKQDATSLTACPRMRRSQACQASPLAAMGQVGVVGDLELWCCGLGWA